MVNGTSSHNIITAYPKLQLQMVRQVLVQLKEI